MFCSQIRGGKLYGRGACDMKGAVAVMMALAKKTFADYPDQRIGLLLTTDEETGGKNGAGQLAKKIKSRLVIVPDGGDSEARISNRTKGVVQVKLSAVGPGGSPGPGVYNPLEGLMKNFLELQKMIKGKNAQYQLNLSATQMAAGEASNQTPVFAELIIDVRFVGVSAQRILSLLKKKLKGKPVKFKILLAFDPSLTRPQDRYLKLYLKTAAKVLNRPIIIRGQNGSHDGRYFSYRGSTVIATRPTSGGMHGDQEWVRISSLSNLYRIFEEYLRVVLK